MPPTSLAETKPVSEHVYAWRGHGSKQYKRGRDAGPMVQQQQQLEREPHQQRLVPQRNSGKQLDSVSREQADKARKDLEKKGQVLPDGQKKKPLPGETTGAARV